MVEQLYVAQYVPSSNLGIRPMKKNLNLNLYINDDMVEVSDTISTGLNSNLEVEYSGVTLFIREILISNPEIFIDVVQAIFIILLVFIKEIRNIISSSLYYSNEEFNADYKNRDENLKYDNNQSDNTEGNLGGNLGGNQDDQGDNQDDQSNNQDDDQGDNQDDDQGDNQDDDQGDNQDDDQGDNDREQVSKNKGKGRATIEQEEEWARESENVYNSRSKGVDYESESDNNKNAQLDFDESLARKLQYDEYLEKKKRIC
jgi:hypothetical protein